MIKRWTYKINLNEERKAVVSNFFSISILNLLNYLFPLLTVPYLLRVVGVELYGKCIFAFAIANYFKVLVDFGFDATVTKDIAIHKQEKEKVSEVFFAVFIAKLFLLLISLSFFCLFYFIVFSMPAKQFLFFFSAFILVFSSPLICNWIFIGYEEAGNITVINGVFKCLYFLLLLFFVKTGDDYIIVPLLHSSCILLSGVVAFVWAIKKYGITWEMPAVRRIIALVKESAWVFVSDFSVALYSTTNVVIIGFLLNDYIVGLYGAMEKVFSALNMIIGSASYAIYPYLSKVAMRSKEALSGLIKKTELIFFIASTAFVVLLNLFSRQVVLLVLHSYNKQAGFYLGLFSIALLLSPMGGLFTRSLILLKRPDYLIRITGSAFIINAVILIALIKLDLTDYLPLCVIVTQFYIILSKRYLTYKTLMAK